MIFKDKRIFFDQDYSPELQKKRSRIHTVIKQLKQKGIQQGCPNYGPRARGPVFIGLQQFLKIQFNMART